MRKSISFLSVLTFLSLTSIPALAGTLHVDAGASGAQDGSSWADAYTDLQEALDAAASGDEIWVAAGTYHPTAAHDGSGDRYRSFQLKNGVGIYGGFAGDETARDQRRPEASETILSGDIGTPGESSDNCYHVFFHPYTLALDETAVLESCTITGGYADSGSFPHLWGGGMYNSYASPTLINCNFRGNEAYVGGGMANYYASPPVSGCIFGANNAYIGGGMADYESSPTVINCTFSGNTASLGGGMGNDASSPTIRNCIFWGDAATSDGNEIYNDGSTPIISASDIEGSGGTGVAWDGDLGTDNGLNIDSDPLFAAADFHLTSDSPCIDTGSNDSVPPGLETDVDGDSRIGGNAVDMGADEAVDTDYDGTPDYLDTDDDNDGLHDGDEDDTYGTDPLDEDTDNDGIDDGAEIYHGSNPLDGGDTPSAEIVIYVDAGATGGSEDGSGWADAFIGLQDALDVAAAGDEIWVAAGTYYPTATHGGGEERHRSFQLKNGVALYGGFAGDETAAHQRSWNTHRTILSGDIDEDGVLDNDNSYHVFYHFVTSYGPSLLDETAVLDGFTITGGYADNSLAFFVGGGMMNYLCSPTIINCAFNENYALAGGGGLYNVSFSTTTVTNCSFNGNDGHAGGGVINGGHMTVTNCSFSGNNAGAGGGVNNQGNMTVTGCSFSGNHATTGGGVYNDDTVSMTVTNCILWGNTATSEGNEIYNGAGTVNISHSDIEGAGGSGGSWDTDLGTDGGGNIDADPLFAAVDDLHLTSGSPCIDAGSNAGVPSDLSTDMDGDTRVDGGTVDMGADEFVDTDGDGTLDYLDTDDDNDGLTDADETGTYGTDPLYDDTDDDGLSDGDEVNTYRTDPLDADTDGDGVCDGDEVAAGSDPLVAETGTGDGDNTNGTDDTSAAASGGGGGGCFIGGLGPETQPLGGFGIGLFLLITWMPGIKKIRRN